MFRHQMAPQEPLSPESLDTIERGWKRLVSEIGVEFMHPEALSVLADAGQRVEGEVVHFDPDWVLEQVRLAPSEFDVRARNPEHDITLGGRHVVCTPVSGPPFFRIGDERRDGTLEDYRLMAKLVQAFPELDASTMPIIEPNDRPLDSRHLDMILAAMSLTDKVVFGSALSDVNSDDSIEMARILFSRSDNTGFESDGPGAGVFRPAGASGHDRPMCSIITIANANSPLRFDTRMLEAMLAYAKAGQAVVVTPFLLMGAMSPVTVASALAQQSAEALTGIALMQALRPGTPAVMGSFLSTIDMQSGSPSFGGPESAAGLLASGQLARRYALPWRAGGGGLTASQTVDAQAGYEAFNTLNAAFGAGANLIVQSAGWLESGLVSCPEKLVMDVELLRTLRQQYTPLVIDDEALAFDAHDEVRHGGHFLGCMHTLERFRDCFYRPMLSSTENFERWTSKGARDTQARAGEIWRATLQEYAQPALDPEVERELQEFVDRRRTELGD
ncbi:MAG: trimethylamine methyltransferase family protein [Actinomycetales bacterium]